MRAVNDSWTFLKSICAKKPKEAFRGAAAIAVGIVFLLGILPLTPEAIRSEGMPPSGPEHVVELQPTVDATWIDDNPIGGPAPPGSGWQDHDFDNWGGTTWLIDGRAVWWPRVYRTGLKFDVSSLAGKTITDVSLKLYFYDVGDDRDSTYLSPVTIGVYRVTRAFSELAVTAVRYTGGANWTQHNGDWADYSGTDYGTTAYATLTLTEPTKDAGGSYVGSYVVWNHTRLTSLVQQWVNGAVPNYGLFLKSHNEGLGTKKYFYSRESGTGLGPRLVVTYSDDTPTPDPYPSPSTTPTNTSTPTPTATATPTPTATFTPTPTYTPTPTATPTATPTPTNTPTPPVYNVFIPMVVR